MPEHSSDMEVAVAPSVFASVPDMLAFLGTFGNNRTRVRISVEGYDARMREHDIRKALMDLFNSCGQIVGLKFSRDLENRPVYRRAFIVLLGDDAQEKALQLNGTDVGGWIVRVRVAPEEDEETESYRIALLNETKNDPKCMFGVGVKGYDTSLPVGALIDHFASCGDITHVFVNPFDSEVHIYFSEENAETRALALYGSVVRGRQLVIRPLVTPRRIVSPPTPEYGGYGFCITDHCLEMAPENQRKILALKISKGMI